MPIRPVGNKRPVHWVRTAGPSDLVDASLVGTVKEIVEDGLRDLSPHLTGRDMVDLVMGESGFEGFTKNEVEALLVMADVGFDWT